MDYTMREKFIQEQNRRDVADWLVQSPEWDDIQEGQEECRRQGRLVGKAIDRLRIANIRANESINKLAIALAEQKHMYSVHLGGGVWAFRSHPELRWRSQLYEWLHEQSHGYASQHSSSATGHIRGNPSTVKSPEGANYHE